MVHLILIIAAILSAVQSQEITVTGPLIDLYCWDDRNGIAWDTGVQLRDNPYAHTVHCLVEVSLCRNSGFAFVNKTNGASQYEISFLLDDEGNQLAITAMYEVPVGAERNKQNGFVFTLNGTPDYSGNRPVLITSTNEPATAQPITSKPTSNPTTSTPTTAKPTFPDGVTGSPTSNPITAEPTTNNPTTTSEYETCIATTEIKTGLSVKIGRKVSDNTMEITLTGPSTHFFAYGFGGTAMEGTYAITIEGDTPTVVERVLAFHASGSIVSPGSISSSSGTDSGNIRSMKLIRPYSYDGTFDFSPLLSTCQVKIINVIAAAGGTTFGYHQGGRAIGTLTSICECDMTTTTMNEEEPTGGNTATVFNVYHIDVITLSLYFMTYL